MPTLLEVHDGLVVDLDGVVYVGPDAVPHAVQALAAARRDGLDVCYLTNNASRPPGDVADHLRRLGLELEDADVVTSAQVAARMVAQRCGAGAPVLAVGGPGVALALRAEGLEPVASAADHPMAVVQGYGREVGWTELAEAAYAVVAGALWVATNTDRTIPTPRGIAPGNGTLVDAVRAAVDVDPVVAGKPMAAAVRFAVDRSGARRPLVLGDRLDTDIEGGRAAGVDTALVLTGVHDLVDAAEAPPERRPTVVLADLRGLRHAAPVVEVDPDGARCGGSEVALDGDRVRVLAPATDPLDAARAALALVWAVRDSGRAVVVPEEVLRDPRLRSVGGGGGG